MDRALSVFSLKGIQSKNYPNTSATSIVIVLDLVIDLEKRFGSSDQITSIKLVQVDYFYFNNIVLFIKTTMKLTRSGFNHV
jgi:hypothetical protein